jgi:hypothetical protein
MNWHQLIEERSYEMHQVIATVLRRDPSRIKEVVNWIHRGLSDHDYSTQSKRAVQEWLAVIEKRGLEGVIEVLEDRGEEAARMRHSSPFAVLMPQDKRLKILRRYEALRARTHPAGV